MAASRRGRTLTILAVGCVLLDGVLLVLAGVWSQRAGLLVAGGVCALVAVGAVVLWRRYQRALEEVDEARRALRQEALALGRAFREGREGTG